MAAGRLVEETLTRLNSLLPEDWVALVAAGPNARRPEAPDGGTDLVVELEAPDGSVAQLFVEFESRSPGPVQLRRRLSEAKRFGFSIRGDRPDSVAGVLVAPWLSARARQLLREHGVGYLDATGNAWLRVSRPAVYVRTDGSDHDPRPRPRGRTTLAGPRAGRLVRLLVDVAPPYHASELAKVAELSLPYVTRILDAVEDQGMLARGRRRVIYEVDWNGLLRARAEARPVLRANDVRPLLSPQGANAFLRQLADIRRDAVADTDKNSADEPIAVTGSCGAAAVAPQAVGGQLMLYLRSPAAVDQLEDILGLLPARRGADVLALVPPDPVVFARPRSVDGLWHVALSQLALDCLSGNGRMPADGEAVLDYMAADESAWRVPSFDALAAQTLT